MQQVHIARPRRLPFPAHLLAREFRERLAWRADSEKQRGLGRPSPVVVDQVVKLTEQLLLSSRRIFRRLAEDVVAKKSRLSVVERRIDVILDERLLAPGVLVDTRDYVSAGIDKSPSGSPGAAEEIYGDEAWS